MSSTVIPFPPRPDAPVTVHPAFNRAPLSRDGMRALESAGEEDRRKQAVTAINRAARAALDIASEGPEKRARAHADLHKTAAAKVETLAQLARSVAAELAALGHILPAHDLKRFADEAEFMSAEVESHIYE